MEAEQVHARELELEQEFNLRLERAVQERVRADAASRTGNISRKEEKKRWTAGRWWRLELGTCVLAINLFCDILVLVLVLL